MSVVSKILRDDAMCEPVIDVMHKHVMRGPAIHVMHEHVTSGSNIIDKSMFQHITTTFSPVMHEHVTSGLYLLIFKTKACLNMLQ